MGGRGDYRALHASGPRERAGALRLSPEHGYKCSIRNVMSVRACVRACSACHTRLWCASSSGPANRRARQHVCERT